MIAPPERSAARDAAIGLLLRQPRFPGWSRAALDAALRATGGEADAALLFPGGAADMVEVFCDLADRAMIAAMTQDEAAPARLSARVREAIARRLAAQRPHKIAVRRAMGLLARPSHAATAARCTARTIEAIWHLAGDRAADFSWYTKRATLAGVYGATLLFWLRDPSEDDAATLAFLDRRLAGVVAIGRLRRRMTGLLPRRVLGQDCEAGG